MKSSYGSYLQERNGWYQFLFTVPKNQKARFGGKAQIRKSLNTQDRRQALIRLGPLVEQYTAMCEPTGSGILTFDSVKERAAALGFDYRAAQAFQTINLQESIATLSAAFTARDLIATPTATERAAIGGAVEVPALLMSKLYARFKEVDPGRVVNLTPEKTRKAWRRYEQKIEDFIAVMGDQDCLKLTKKTVLEYRNKLIVRIQNGDFKSAAANEYFEKVRTAWRKVIEFDYGDLNVPDPFDKVDGIDFKDGGKKEEFTEEEVVAIRRVLDESQDVEPELRSLMLMSQNTGCGADELVYMAPEDIVLDDEIPHLKIRPNIHRKKLKNGHRPRYIPLLGVAFEEAKKYPNGFTKYCTPSGPNKVSEDSAVYIKQVAPTKSFGCYRHRIATLMRNNEDIKDQFQDAVMGHGSTGMTGYYGSKPWLEKLAKALKTSLPENA